jgi:hypothetical protein
MSRIEQKLRENETHELEKAVDAWDRQSTEDYLRLLELAYDQPGAFAHVARARAPESFARVGLQKAA